jgi:hypothetical protein
VTAAAAPTVAALYVEPAGVYANTPGVELWSEARDARLYAGPWPVVAHPPCNRWGALAFLNRHLHGYAVGDDGGCFEAALRAVRDFGGVLEHPAYSLAWRYFGLPRPVRDGWAGSLTDPGWVTELDQAAYGHRARKRTWLYYVGPDPRPLDWTLTPGTRQISSFAHAAPGAFTLPESRRVRPLEAARTPEAFRDALLELARGARLDRDSG